MSVTQLQAVVRQCRILLQAILYESRDIQIESEELAQELVQLRRQEINELKAQTQISKRQQQQKKELVRYISAFQSEIDKCRRLNIKENQQKDYLHSLIEKNRLKMIAQNQRITQIHQEEPIMKQFELQIEESVRNKSKYDILKKKLKNISAQMVQQKIKNHGALREKQQQLKMIREDDIVIDTKIAYIQNQICVQQQIIRQISRIQEEQTPFPTIEEEAFQILNKEGQAILQREPDLDAWERHQVKSIMEEKQFQKDREKQRMGYIRKQPLRNENNKTVKRKYFNYSADLSKAAKEITQLPHFRGPNHFISKQRMSEMQKNKRIRTRFTPPKVSKSTKPIIVQPIRQQSQFSSTKNSILNAYETFLKGKMQKNPGIIKVRRESNKVRRLTQDSKGVALQAQYFS